MGLPGAYPSIFFKNLILFLHIIPSGKPFICDNNLNTKNCTEMHLVIEQMG